jgi:hypothetical protein
MGIPFTVIWYLPGPSGIVPIVPATPEIVGDALAETIAGQVAAHPPVHALLPEPAVSLSKK